MQLAQSFEVAAPIDRVWKALIDIEHVAPCLPGAAVTARNDDGSYQGSFSVKIGPTSASYTGKLEMLEIDEAEHRAMMYANGTDKRGQGGATATIVSKLSGSAAGGTHVEVQTDYKITGRLARFGRGGMIEDISERLLRQFADRLATSLVEEPAPAEEGQGGGGPSASAGSETAPSGTPTAGAEGKAGDETQARSHATFRAPPAPAELPDMGRLATEAVLGRFAQSPVGVAVIAFLFGYVLGVLRGRRR